MMRKAEKLTHLSQRIKKDKIKETQDSWRSQFEENDQEKLQKVNLNDKYRDLNKQRRLGQQDQGEQQDQQSKIRKQLTYDQQARNQQIVQLQGERIYLKGLDLGMLKRQKELQKKRKTNPDFTARINQKMKLAESVKKVSSNKLYKEMIERIKNPNPIRSKPTLNQNTYYDFDINWTFGALVPKLITKQPPRHHKNPSFPNITTENIDEIFNIILTKRKREQLQKQQQVEQQKIIEQDSDEYQSIQHSIFADVKQDNIEVGAKLQFNVGSIDNLYQPKVYEDKPDNEIDMKIMQLEKAQKRKRLMEEQDEGDYYEELWGTGPSLEHLKDLRKEGISYYQFYDNKNNRKGGEKEKKVDYNKEYDKIQRIIAEKEGKK